MATAERRTPEAFLAARVDELDGHWLELLCGCGARAFCPLKLLAKKYGATRIDQLYGRFKCQQCGGRPVRVAVTNSPARGPQYPGAWSVALVEG